MKINFDFKMDVMETWKKISKVMGKNSKSIKRKKSSTSVEERDLMQMTG